MHSSVSVEGTAVIALAGSSTNRWHLLLFAVILVVLTTLGIRAVPEAAAAERVEVGTSVIETTDDDQIRYTDTNALVRYDDKLPPEYQAPTLEEVKDLASEVNSTVKKNLGWDLTNADDRERAEVELDGLAQVLHSFKEDLFESETMASLRKLRDIVDQLDITKCRQRCLDAETLNNVINMARIYSMVNELFATIDPADEMGVAILAVSALMTGLIPLPFLIVPLIAEIPSTSLQGAVLQSMKVLLTFVKSSLSDALELNSKNPGTAAELAHSEAQDIAHESPSKEDTGKEYDLVKDEL